MNKKLRQGLTLMWINLVLICSVISLVPKPAFAEPDAAPLVLSASQAEAFLLDELSPSWFGNFAFTKQGTVEESAALVESAQLLRQVLQYEVKYSRLQLHTTAPKGKRGWRSHDYYMHYEITLEGTVTPTALRDFLRVWAETYRAPLPYDVMVKKGGRDESRQAEWEVETDNLTYTIELLERAFARLDQAATELRRHTGSTDFSLEIDWEGCNQGSRDWMRDDVSFMEEIADL